MRKICTKCGEDKSLDDYYKQRGMKDGHFNKCKDCYKYDVKGNRENNIEYYRDYDRRRGNRQTKEYFDGYYAKYPNKYKAQTMVGNAIRDKKLFKEACEVCGTEGHIHAHHDDYLKPLNVRWLCSAHHSQWHSENGEGKNGS